MRRILFFWESPEPPTLKVEKLGPFHWFHWSWKQDFQFFNFQSRSLRRLSTTKGLQWPLAYQPEPPRFSLIISAYMGEPGWIIVQITNWRVWTLRKLQKRFIQNSISVLGLYEIISISQFFVGVSKHYVMPGLSELWWATIRILLVCTGVRGGHLL